MAFTVIIPARYQSSRLSAKLLADINGKSMLERTYIQAKKSKAKQVIIATDDKRIMSIAQGFGAEVYMTSKQHKSGTTRLIEVIKKQNLQVDIVVNVQGDEPMIAPELINQVAHNLTKTSHFVATLCTPIQTQTEYEDSNCVKVVRDKNNNALYFSRANIPAFRDGGFNATLCYRHIGLYAYKTKFLSNYIQVNQHDYEQAEKLEQLSILQSGFGINVDTAVVSAGIGVDTQADLDKVRILCQ